MRDKFKEVVIKLDSMAAKNEFLILVTKLPIDHESPLQVVIREVINPRTLGQNKLYHAIVSDIADQLWIEKKRYLPDVWSHYLKELFLPELAEPAITKSGYTKWMQSLSGDRILFGSTTDLKVKGMTDFISKITLYAAEHGVIFTEQ